MKKQLLLPALLLSFGLSAQVTLTYAVHGWQPGDNYNFVPCDTVGVNPGSSGTGQTWNFSTLNENGTPSTSSYVSPGSTPYSSSFPTATCANGASSSYYFYTTNSGGISIVGLGTAAYIMTYSNPDQLITFPFAYGNSSNDTHAASYTVSSFTGTRGGYTNVTADGSGTLVLPSGSYNVLRTKWIQQDRDSFAGSGFITTSTIYSWYSANQKFPLMQIQFMSQVSSSGTTNSKVVYVNSAVAGVENSTLLSGLNCFPNPAQNELHINASLAAASDVTIELTDLSGRLVYSSDEGRQPEGELNRVIDLSGMSSGLYLLSIHTGESVTTQRVAVQ